MHNCARIFVAGHQGMIGSAVMRELAKEGFNNLLTQDRHSLDLTDQRAVTGFFDAHKPDYVVLAAGRTGGIIENERNPAEFLYTNLSIALHVLSAASQHQVKKLVFLASSCMYPKHCPQPMQESLLLTGKPEETSMGTAIAKLAGVELCLAYNRQHGAAAFIPIIPNNAYGPYDDFNPATGHVLSSLIARFHKAKLTAAKTVELWGSGTPRREFIHANDIARACIALLRAPVMPEQLPMNVGVGEDISIRDLAHKIASIVGYTGVITWDTQKPDGSPQKLLDSSRIRNLGWAPSVTIDEGIKSTYQWYLEHIAKNATAQAMETI